MQTENIEADFKDFPRFTVRVEDPSHIRREGEQKSTQDQSQNYCVEVNYFKRVQDHFFVL